MRSCGGLSDSAIPDVDAVVWRPERLRGALTIFGSVGAVIARLGRCNTSIVRERGGIVHVLARRGTAQIQVVVRPAGACGSPDIAVAVPRDLAAAQQAARAMAAFVAFGLGRSVKAARESWDLGARLVLVLRALDGSLSGAKQRQIAEALFGQARVRRDWRDPRGNLRDITRRAIRRGRFLMNRGYLQLLRRGVG